MPEALWRILRATPSAAGPLCEVLRGFGAVAGYSGNDFWWSLDGFGLCGRLESFGGQSGALRTLETPRWQNIEHV